MIEESVRCGIGRVIERSICYLIKWYSVWRFNTHEARPDSSITASSSSPIHKLFVAPLANRSRRRELD